MAEGPGSGVWMTKGGMKSWWLMECNIELSKQEFFKGIHAGFHEELGEARFLDIEAAKRLDGGTAGENVGRSITEFNKLLGMTMGIHNHLHMFNAGASKFAPDKAVSETKDAMQQVLDTLAFHWRRALASNLHRDQGSEISHVLCTIREHAKTSCGCSFPVASQAASQGQATKRRRPLSSGR